MVSMKIKNGLIGMLIGVCLLLSGCGNAVNIDIPDTAIALSDQNENTYINPNDSEDSYRSVEINGVIYIPYGTQGKSMTNKEIGACIAYSESDSRERFYAVNGNTDFIANYYVDSEMQQFDFWRSVDTLGKEREVPDFIEDLGYEIWK
jgi:hypothetical protein